MLIPIVGGGEIKNGKEAAGDDGEFSLLVGIFTYLTFMGEFNCFWFMHHIRGIKKAFKMLEFLLCLQPMKLQV